MKKITLLLSLLIISFTAQAQYFVDFEGDGETNPNYAASTVNLSGLDWEIGPEALIGTLDNDFKNGERSARLRGRNGAVITMVEDKVGGIGQIVFEYRIFGSDGGQEPWVVEYSSNAGQDWTQAGEPFIATADVATFSADVNVEGNARIRIRINAEPGESGNRRINIDDILLTDFGAAGDPSLNVTSPAEDVVLSPLTTSVNVNLSVLNFPLSSSATADDGDGYVQYSLNQSPFVDVFTNSFELDDLSEGAYSLIVKLVDNEGNDLDPEVQVTRNFSVAGYTQVASISELRDAIDVDGAGGFYQVTGASIFTHGDNFNNRKWFQDNNGGGIQIFDPNAIIANDAYVLGDNVENISGQAGIFNGVYQLTPLEDTGVTNGTTEPNVVLLTMENYVNNFQNFESILIGIQNVTYSAGDGSAVFANGQNYMIEAGDFSITHRTDFFDVDYIGTTIPQGMIEGVRGIAASFNGNPRILPRNLADIDVSLSTIQFDRNQFSIFPNPATTTVNLEVPRGETFDVSVYNVLGREVLKSKAEGNTQLNVQNFQSGVYLVRFSQGSQNYTRKLIVR